LDFYFANHLEPDSAIDEFSLRQLIVPSEHRRLDRGSSCYQFIGDMQDQIIRGNVIETSTVVFRWSRLNGVRFAPGYRTAFEDHLFWLDTGRVTGQIAFSTDVECRYGRGVGLWRSSTSGDALSFSRILDQMRFIRRVRSEYVTTDLQAQALRKRIRGLRRAFVLELLHRARRGIAIDWRVVIQIVKQDPMLLALSLPMAVRIIRGRMTAA
jgi:succinoglycan biosynthesis protein ExoW